MKTASGVFIRPWGDTVISTLAKAGGEILLGFLGAMHFKRWLTGIIAVPILIFVIGFAPRWLFYAMVFSAAVMALGEFLGMAAPKLPAPAKALSFLFILFFFAFLAYGPFFLILAVLCLAVMALFALYLFGYASRRAQAIEDVASTALGLLYICLPLSLLLMIDKHPRGPLWIFFLLAVTFFNDTGAFYVGRSLGRHKLCSILAAYVFSRFFTIYDFNWFIIVLASVLSVFGQVGDLAESMVKRLHGVKDSGKILPGHGGLLDRIDGLLFSVPVLYVFLTWSVR
jgi:phosphatidate cytidylyltransferase